MIIRKITIENFLCYYGIKEFELANGLNIVLGENGEGKTKLYEAIDWLLNGDNKNLELLVSAKMLEEAQLNESFVVRVSMTFEQNTESKILIKSFLAKKSSSSDCETSNCVLEGIEENKSGERVQVDGKDLLDRVFPIEVRRYSMFKGEEQLNIFKNDDALSNLINSFSRSKYYDKYAEKGSFLRDKAEKAVEESTRRDRSNQQDYNRLENEISRLQTEKHKYVIFHNNTEEQISKTEEYIQDAEKYVENAEALETINTRIKKLERQILDTESLINENYTTNLFDENWILVHFTKVQKEFTEKVSFLSKRKRELQTEHDKKIGIKEGKKQLKAEILNNKIPLPIGVPSRAHMEEMLKDELCKVCNRPVEKDSEPYNFMFKRLSEYLKSQEPNEKEEKEEESLFKHNYLNRLFNLSVSLEDNLVKIRKIKGLIKDQFELNEKRRNIADVLKENLTKEREEREKIIGKSSMGEDKLTNVLKNYNAWQRDLVTYRKDLSDYEAKIASIEAELIKKREEKDKIDTKSAHTFLIKTRGILRDIETIFKDVKERKFDEFIKLLQEKSNNFFERINVEAFTGTIVFTKKFIGGKTKIIIELHEGERVFHKPNQSLLTSMHISILFAISELASENKMEKYPMIFDAPTSSFGETKTAEFLNLIYETKDQNLLLLKDFLITDEQTKTLNIKPEFKNVKRNRAFWIRLQRPFDKKILKTLNTEVITL